MKIRKTFLTLAIVGFMALFLCLPASVFAGPGPNPGGAPAEILQQYKPQGPSPEAFVMIGWRPYVEGERPANCTDSNFGVLEYFVWVDDMLFREIQWDCYNPVYLDNAYIGPPPCHDVDTVPADIVFLDDPDDCVENDEEWWDLDFPALRDAYGLPADTYVVVYELKDVREYAKEFLPATEELSYRIIIRGNFKLTFLVKKTK
jgi:hypothetical protein